MNKHLCSIDYFLFRSKQKWLFSSVLFYSLCSMFDSFSHDTYVEQKNPFSCEGVFIIRLRLLINTIIILTTFVWILKHFL